MDLFGGWLFMYYWYACLLLLWKVKQCVFVLLAYKSTFKPTKYSVIIFICCVSDINFTHNS